MPYKKHSDLPPAVRDHLPKHGQEIFMKAFNSAWDEYSDPGKRRGHESQEEVAFKVAWSAVGNEYEKDEQSGDWKKK
ncbi:MAG TPA: ChaB family protein [Phototrophicaceae bacterium]|nr:ChaB family protein [Phototrophicaceae bacterium]